MSKTVPTKGTVEKKNLCKRRKATLETHESREEKGEEGERMRWEAERRGECG